MHVKSDSEKIKSNLHCHCDFVWFLKANSCFTFQIFMTKSLKWGIVDACTTMQGLEPSLNNAISRYSYIKLLEKTFLPNSVRPGVLWKRHESVDAFSGPITNSSDVFPKFFHEFFSLWVVKKESKLHIGLKQCCFLSLAVEEEITINI